MNSFENVAFHVVLCAVLIGVLAMCAYVPRAMYVRAVCLEAGWASSRVAWDMSGYCVREENAYDIVKPFREVVPE